MMHSLRAVKLHDSINLTYKSTYPSEGYVMVLEKLGTVSYLSALPFMCAAKQLVQTNRQPPAGASSCTPTLFKDTHTHKCASTPYLHNQ